MKNQEKIIEIGKSGDKVLALILGRTVMNDRELLRLCLNNAKDFSAVQAWQDRYRILQLHISPISITFEVDRIRYFNTKTLTRSSLIRSSKTDYNSFHRFLNSTCGPRPRKPKQI